MKILTAVVTAAALAAIAAPAFAEPVQYSDMNKDHAEQRMENHMGHHDMMMRHRMMRHHMMMMHHHHHHMMHHEMEHHDDAH